MRRVRVGDVLELKRLPVEIDPFDEYVPIGIRSFGKGIFHYEPTPGEELSKLRFFEVRPRELVLSNIKAWEGAIAVSTEDERGCIASNRFLTYVPKANGADVSYLRYFFLSDAGLPLIQRASPGSADRNRTLAIDRFEALEIPLPPLDVQQRVARRLTRLLPLARQAETVADAAMTTIEALRWSTLRRIFERLIYDFGVVLLEEAVVLNPEPVRPEIEFANSEFLYVDISSVPNGSGRIEDATPIAGVDAPVRARKRIRAGDVLVSTVRPNLRAFARVPAELDGAVCSTGFAVLRPRTGVDSQFLLLQVLADSFVEQLVAGARGGHYPAVNDATLRSATVVVPNVNTQKSTVLRLERSLTALDEALMKMEHRLRTTQALENSMLNQLISSSL